MPKKKHVDNINQPELLSYIPHKVNKFKIDQRAIDGYVNATELCKAAGKLFADYTRSKTTKEFLNELSGSMGIPIDVLIQKIIKGPNYRRGTWIHPQIAVNLATWASPKFAVVVSKWVSDWMNGNEAPTFHKLPYHIRRYLKNRKKIPPTHFSMLDEMTLQLIAPLEQKGYELPPDMVPDISMGLFFSKWCRDNGHEPEDFPSYLHEYEDGRVVEARLYPYKLKIPFNYEVLNWIKDKSIKYFKPRDPSAIEPLEELRAEMSLLEDVTESDLIEEIDPESNPFDDPDLVE